MWVTVAKVHSVAELEKVEPWIKHVALGEKGKVKVEGLPLSAAKVFDLALAEHIFGQHLVPQGARVIDCYEEGGVGYVDFEITGTPVHLLLFGIAAALFALSIFIVTITVSLQLTKLSPEMFSWQLLLLVALGLAAVVIAFVLIARYGRMAVGPVKVGK